jgi:hypothetical protein
LGLAEIAELFVIPIDELDAWYIAVIELEKPRNVHMDESRQDRWGVPIYSVSGYVSSYRGFFDLDDEWNKFLTSKKIEVFHTKEFLHRDDEFANDWTDRERNDFIDRLAWIASEHTTLGFGTSIREDVYNEVFGGNPNDEAWKGPYGFCLWSCLVMLYTLPDWSRVRLQRPLNILFDDKPEFHGTALKIFNELKVLNDPKGETFGDFGFGNKARHPSLQAADLITYETTRHWIEVEHQGEAMEMHRVVKILNRKETLMTPNVSYTESLLEFRKFLDGFVGPMPDDKFIRKQLNKQKWKKKKR